MSETSTAYDSSQSSDLHENDFYIESSQEYEIEMQIPADYVKSGTQKILDLKPSYHRPQTPPPPPPPKTCPSTDSPLPDTTKPKHYCQCCHCPTRFWQEEAERLKTAEFSLRLEFDSLEFRARSINLQLVHEMSKTNRLRLEVAKEQGHHRHYEQRAYLIERENVNLLLRVYELEHENRVLEKKIDILFK